MKDIGNGHHAHTERYVYPQFMLQVFTHRRSFKDFSDVRLVQKVDAHEGAIWTMKFSNCGKYLATSGQDLVVKVWRVGDLGMEAVNNAQKHSTVDDNEHYSRSKSKRDHPKILTPNSSIRSCQIKI